MYVPPDVTLPTVSGVVSGGLLKKKTKKAIQPGIASGITTRSHVGSEYDSRSIASSDAVIRQPSPVVATEEPAQEEISDSPKDEAVVPDPISEPVAELVPEPVTPDEESEVLPVPEVPMVAVDDKGSKILDTVRRERELISIQRDMKIELEALLAKQNEFCEAEKYDDATLLDSDIENLKQRLLELNRELLIEIPILKQSILKNNIEKTCAVVEDMRKDQKSKQEELAAIQAEIESEKLILDSKLTQFSEVDSLFVDKESELNQRKKDLKDREADLETRILKESHSVAEQKLEAEASYEDVDKEIEELQTQLAQAMAKRSELAMIISASELKLSTIRVAYSQELEEVDDIKTEIELSASELLKEKEAAGGGDRCSVEAALKNLEAKQDKLTTSLMTAVDFIDHSISDHEKLLAAQQLWWKKESELILSIQGLREQVIEAEEYEHLLVESLRDAEAKLAAFKENTVEMKQRLPQLEEEKRSAIANRSFKEAKDLTNEIKEISDAISELEKTQNDLRAKVKSARGELAEANDVLAQLQLEMQSKQEAFDENHRVFLRTMFDDVSELMKELSNEELRAILAEYEDLCKIQLEHQ